MWDQWLQSMGQAGEVGGEANQIANGAPTAPSTPAVTFQVRLKEVIRAMPWWRWLLTMVGSLCLLLGTITLVQTGQSAAFTQEAQTALATDSASESASVVSPAVHTPVRSKVYVDVAGAVANPGVYELEETDRAGAAVMAAGGFTATAHQMYLKKYFNAAAPITDGEKMYIPFAVEEIKSESSSLSSNQGNNQHASGTENTTSRLISINTASADELDTLPGIGAVRAQQIIEGRPYQSLEELESRKIITSSIYQSLEGLIRL